MRNNQTTFWVILLAKSSTDEIKITVKVEHQSDR